MKKTLFLSFVAALMASSANAATLSMWFPGMVDEITVAPGDEFVVDVYVELIGDETLFSVFYPNGLATGLFQTGIVAAPDGTPDNWNAVGNSGILGGGAQQFAVEARHPLLDSIDLPGVYLIGRQYIYQTLETGDYEIVFGDPLGESVGLLDMTGLPFTWYGYGGHYSGYYSYGKGSPYVSASKGGLIPGQAADPLIVHCIPEPTALLLLPLGGWTVMRPRRS